MKGRSHIWDGSADVNLVNWSQNISRWGDSTVTTDWCRLMSADIGFADVNCALASCTSAVVHPTAPVQRSDGVRLLTWFTRLCAASTYYDIDSSWRRLPASTLQPQTISSHRHVFLHRNPGAPSDGCWLGLMLLGLKKAIKVGYFTLNISVGQTSTYVCVRSFMMENISWALNWIKIGKKDYLTDSLLFKFVT